VAWQVSTDDGVTFERSPGPPRPRWWSRPAPRRTVTATGLFTNLADTATTEGRDPLPRRRPGDRLSCRRRHRRGWARRNLHRCGHRVPEPTVAWQVSTERRDLPADRRGPPRRPWWSRPAPRRTATATGRCSPTSPALPPATPRHSPWRPRPALAPAAQPGASGAGGDGGFLANTGSPVTTALIVALVLIGVGGALVIPAIRRRTKEIA